MSETYTTAEEHSGIQRPLALVILLAAGVFALPLSALFLDEDGNENWILPAAFGVMALVGALVGGALPGLAGSHATRTKGRWVGALVGVAMVVIGTLIFFLLINGFEGA